MALTQTQFDDLVARLTKASERAPDTYKAKVALLALGGYAYIFLVLAVLSALTFLVMASLVLSKAGVLAIKLGIPLLVLVCIIMRALWVRLAPPDGTPITREEAPVLFAAIDEIRAATHGPRTHQVLVTDDFNAAVTQIPRLGLFGWPKNYLIIGLPLAQALSPDQFRAVLCHEYGHLSRAHARFSNWIYRMRLTWARLMGALESAEHWGVFVFRRFVRWYVPYFNAYSFVLARANEYEADAFSARICGASTTASALTGVEVRARFLSERYWPGIYKTADRDAAPSFAPYADLAGRYASGVVQTDANTWLEQALRRKTGTDDTHPALADRLSALKQPAKLDPLPQENAARYFLGSTLDKLTAAFDALWLNRVQESWQQRYEYAHEAQAKLAALEAKAAHAQLEGEEAWNRAQWTEEFKSTEDALPMYQAIVAADAKPDTPVAAAHLAVGRILLARGDARGIGNIEKALTGNHWLTLEGCGHVIAYFLGNGDTAGAQPWRERANERAELEDAAQAERASLPFTEVYMRHGLAETELAPMREVFATVPDIDRVYLVRKKLQHFPDVPLYVVGFRNKMFARSEKNTQAIQQRLVNALQCPGEFFVLPITGNNSPIASILKKVEHSEVYRR